MLGDISLGQYVSGQSALHRLDPRTKILSAAALSVGVLHGTDVLGATWHIGLTVALLGVANLRAAFVVRSLKPFAWLAAIVFLSHVLVGGAAAWVTVV